MDFQKYTELVSEITIGKHLPEAVYLHRSAISELPKALESLIPRVSSALNIDPSSWNIIKLAKRDFKLSFLSYPTFEQDPYPPLSHSWTIDLAKLSVREADYGKSDNPPILHRRETFLATRHPKAPLFAEFTKEGEEIGLYENTRIIGTREGWHRLIARKGYYLDQQGHLKKLVEKEVNTIPALPSGGIERHKTALSRDKLSLPLFLIAKRGYLDGSYSVLDYGCGRGDDIRELEAHDVDCVGWDPVYSPETDPVESDIVNLGYVINVIEDRNERVETLRRAFSFASKFLLVSAMLGNETVFEKYKAYGDGVITARNTFQKYFFQSELKQFIETYLDETAVALSPGVFAVFKDRNEEQLYLSERLRTRHQWRQISSLPKKQTTAKKAITLFEKHNSLLEDFWFTCLDLGRLPSSDEFELSEQVKHIAGSFNKAFAYCSSHFGTDDFAKAQNERRNDLLVYFALSFFNKKRQVFSRMPYSIQCDVKAFFGKYTYGRKEGEELLYSVADIDVIFAACEKAYSELPASVLNGQHDFVFHKDYLNLCPIQIRTYVGCATQLYGELENVSLIKVHILSGKVSLMVYDDWSKEEPLLTERIKIKLREQEIDFFDYVGEYQPQPLFNKSSFTKQ